MSFITEFQHLKISLQDLKTATNNFAETNCIGRGGFGKVYKGETLLSGVLTMVAVKRLDRSFGQGPTQFWKEIMMLYQYRHENLVSLLGFCDEDGENLLVYEYLSKKSLDLYLDSVDLSWHQRLVICLEAAMGLQYLHEPVEGSQQRVLHRDIKSANILLDHNWRPKIADFGLSKLGPANQQFTFLFSNAVGTMGYCDPLYAHTCFLTKESDVYSFGVVLFEVLCGRRAYVEDYNDIHKSLAVLARKCYEEKNLDTIIHISLKDVISARCLETFSTIAYQCLQLDHGKRPTMGKVTQELSAALHYQSIHQKTMQEMSRKQKHVAATMQKFESKGIQAATNNFTSYIGKNRYGEWMYEGELSISRIPTRVLIISFPEHSLGRTPSYYLELVNYLSKLRHPNFISPLGYCNEETVKILVYEYVERGSLDQYIRRSRSSNTNTTSLTWQQRLDICAGAAHGLSYLHDKTMLEKGFKSASIVLDDKWVAKIGDYLRISSTQCSTGLDRGAVINHVYNSPEYIINGKETNKNNVYSFGMVLFEVLCGRLCTEKVDGAMLSAKLIKDLYENKKLDKIVDPVLLREDQQIYSYSVQKYSAIAYQCLLDDPQQRPSMADVVKELEELLSIERIHQSTLQEVPLKEIQVTTNNFTSYIRKNHYGDQIYEGELSIAGITTKVYILRFLEHSRRSKISYLEIMDIYSKLYHPNLYLAIGYCYEEREKVIVYEYPVGVSLDQYVRHSSNTSYTALTWQQRLEICAGAGRGLAYLHNKNLCEDGFKSALIFLDDKWIAKVADSDIFTQCSTGLYKGVVINHTYNSPEYINGKETKENNVYSFGIVLFEVLCGRLFTEEVDGIMLSSELIKDLYENKKLDEIVDPVLFEKEKISSYSVDTYSTLAYRCLSYNPQERPSMDVVVKELDELLSIEVVKSRDYLIC